MMYQFPIIKHINDVLPAIQDKEEFIIAEKKEYTVINYRIMGNDTFPPVNDHNTAIMRECRGLIFDLNGDLISRPFHKFFNLGEREETLIRNVDWSVPYNIQIKNDGSMIRPLLLNSELRLATKMGITDTSMNAEVFVATRKNYINFCIDMCKAGYTPIFEWCSRKNKIVIDYPEDQLILLAIRHNHTGRYEPYEMVRAISNTNRIPHVNVIQHSSIDENFINQIKDLKNEEGVVITFVNGHKIKLKADEYVTIHRAKEGIMYEYNIIQLIVNDQLDDVIAMMPDDLKVKLIEYENNFWHGVLTSKKKLDTIFKKDFYDRCNSDRKTFALTSDCDKRYKSFVFTMADGKASLDVIIDFIRSKATTITRTHELRDLWNCEWKI